MILYRENPMGSTKPLLELKNIFSKVAVTKLIFRIFRNQFYFYMSIINYFKAF